MSNIIHASFGSSHTTIARESAYQYDYGQILDISGIQLPDVYEVHFCKSGDSQTKPVLGNNNQVTIPDEYLAAPGLTLAYIFLHNAEDDGETVYVIKIDVRSRPEPTDIQPTPVQQDVIAQTIGAVQSAMTAWQNMTAEAVTLQPDEEATASYANGVLTLGIPKGEKGDDGSGAVESVNGQTGAVVLNASDVGAMPSTTTIPSKTSDLVNDSGFLTSVPVQSVNGKTGSVVLNASDVGAISTEVDPTVPSWAKQPSKPSYTASEVGALPSTTNIPSKTSDLTNDIGFLTAIPSEYVTDTELQTAISGKANTADLATVATSGNYNDLSNKPTIPTVPTNVSAFTNDAGYITSAPVSSVNGQTGAVVISTATTSADGLLSATDKQHLDALYDDYSSAMTALGV